MRERRLRHTVFIDFVEVEDASDFYVSAETKGLTRMSWPVSTWSKSTLCWSTHVCLAQSRIFISTFSPATVLSLRPGSGYAGVSTNTTCFEEPSNWIVHRTCSTLVVQGSSPLLTLSNDFPAAVLMNFLHFAPICKNLATTYHDWCSPCSSLLQMAR